MLVNFSNVQNIFIVCDHTDMRCGIDGLAGIITDKYNLDLFNDALFLFCGRKKDRFKALYWDKDGFILLYKIFLITLNFYQKVSHFLMRDFLVLI